MKRSIKNLENNFQALLREQQLSYDKEWLRAQASARYIGSNTKAAAVISIFVKETGPCTSSL